MLKKKIYLFIMLGITFLVPIDTSTMAPQQISKERAEISNKIKQADTLAKLANLKGAIDQLGKHSKSFAEQLRKAYQQKEKNLQDAIQAQESARIAQAEQTAQEQAQTIALQENVLHEAWRELEGNIQFSKTIENLLKEVSSNLEQAKQAHLNLPADADKKTQELAKQIDELKANLAKEKKEFERIKAEGAGKAKDRMILDMNKRQEDHQTSLEFMQQKIHNLELLLEEATQAATPEQRQALEQEMGSAPISPIAPPSYEEQTQFQQPFPPSGEASIEGLLEEKEIPLEFKEGQRRKELAELPFAAEEEIPEAPEGEITARLEAEEQEVVEPAESEEGEAKSEEINALVDKVYNFITDIKADGFSLKQEDESKIALGINNVFSNIQKSHPAEDIVSQLKIVDSDISKQVQDDLIKKIKELFPGGLFGFLGGKAKVISQELETKWSTIFDQKVAPPLPPRGEAQAMPQEQGQVPTGPEGKEEAQIPESPAQPMAEEQVEAFTKAQGELKEIKDDILARVQAKGLSEEKIKLVEDAFKLPNIPEATVKMLKGVQGETSTNPSVNPVLKAAKVLEHRDVYFATLDAFADRKAGVRLPGEEEAESE